MALCSYRRVYFVHHNAITRYLLLVDAEDVLIGVLEEEHGKGVHNEWLERPGTHANRG